MDVEWCDDEMSTLFGILDKYKNFIVNSEVNATMTNGKLNWEKK